MSSDEIYEILQAPHRKRLEIGRLQNVIRELELCLLPRAIQYDADKVQTSPDDTLSSVCAQIFEQEQKIRALNEERIEAIMRADALICMLDNSAERAVLTEYYINRERMEDIADHIGYSRRSVYNLRKRGIEKLKICIDLH